MSTPTEPSTDVTDFEGGGTTHDEDPDDLDRIGNIEAAIEHVEAAADDVNGITAPTTSSLLTTVTNKLERAKQLLEG